MAQKATMVRRGPSVSVVSPDLVEPIAPPVRESEALLSLHIETVFRPQAYGIAKRVLDVIAAGLALVLLSPLLLIAALLVRFTSPGPVLFRQQRVGEGGRVFMMYKFRSMRVDADSMLHQLAYERFVQGQGGDGKVGHDVLTLAGLVPVDVVGAADSGGARPGQLRAALQRLRAALASTDPRVTGVGHLLRLTSLDELPQLYNVLVGDMSLVGPRPPIPYEVRYYKTKHLRRLSVLPGLTGFWQVYGRNRVSFEQMVDMDIAYIESRSFWLDLKLLLLTVPSMVLHRTAK